MDLSKIKKVHIIGIGGLGMSAVAKLLLNQGKTVTGSDLVDSETVETLINFGAQIKTGEHLSENVADDCDLIIFTDAVAEDNPERIKSKQLNIESLSYFQFPKHYLQMYGCYAKTGRGK